MHEVHKRRYLLRASALELFFRETPAVFLNLLTRPRRRKLLSKLQSACLHSLQVVDPRDLTLTLTLTLPLPLPLTLTLTRSSTRATAAG